MSHAMNSELALAKRALARHRNKLAIITDKFGREREELVRLIAEDEARIAELAMTPDSGKADQSAANPRETARKAVAWQRAVLGDSERSDG